MNLYILTLRLIHIFAGVFWAGGVFFLVGFLEPTVRAAGQEGTRFMQRFSGGKFTPAMGIAAPLNVLTGILLYLNDSGGLNPTWILTGTGITFTIGAIAGVIAFVVGFFVSRPTAIALGALGKEIQRGGKPPSPEQMGKLQTLQETLTKASLYTALLIVVTVSAMALARYI